MNKSFSFPETYQFPSQRASFKVIRKSRFKLYDRKEARVAEVAGMRTRSHERGKAKLYLLS